jgi:mono/diheme cytochrome c family protein
VKLLRILALVGMLLASGVAVADEASLSPQELQGKHAYDRICIYCHGPGVWGANRLSKRLGKDHALLETRTDLPAPAIRAIVRSGVGSMPPMRKTELSDSDVDAIAAYLTRQTRQQGGGP